MISRLLKSTVAGLALCLAFGLPAFAQVSNQATQMTFTHPVEIPGKRLPAGTYWFTVLDSGPNGNPNEVQVKNGRWYKGAGYFHVRDS